jgi:RsiW-degrading membrane proteinase PrsW (M82 family)
LAEILNREEVPKIINSKLISMAMAVGISLLENSRQSYSADSNQTVNKTIPLFFKKKSSYPKG